MANTYFSFKQFTIRQDRSAFKVTTDGVLLGAWAELEGAQRILDIGTGTGLLVLMAAQRSHAHIIGVEPDKRSFGQAQSNINESPWASRINLINSTIQDYIPENGLLFDTILTNPPFFTGSLLNPDPRKALARHNRSLLPAELLSAANRLLSDKGTLQLVLPRAEGNLFIAEASISGLYCYRLLKVKPGDSYPPGRILMALGHEKRTPEESFLIIEKGGRHQYSDEYISLTREFYLDR